MPVLPVDSGIPFTSDLPRLTLHEIEYLSTLAQDRIEQIQGTEGITAICLFSVRERMNSGPSDLLVRIGAGKQRSGEMTRVRHNITPADVMFHHTTVDVRSDTACLLVHAENTLVYAVQKCTSATREICYL